MRRFIKEYLNQIDEVFKLGFSVIGDVLRVYALSLVIPITLTVMITFLSIIDSDMAKYLLEMLSKLWYGYYIDGDLFGVEAYRIHLGLLFLIFLFVVVNKLEEVKL